MATPPVIPSFGKIDGNKSVLSNFKILDQNWEKLKKYLQSLQQEIGEIIHDIDLNTLIQTVLENISSVKMKFELNPNITEETQIVNNITYKLEKIDNDTIQISRIDASAPAWNLSQSLFQCKEKINGNVVYPNIQLISHNNGYKMNISFNNWNNTIYDLVIM